MITGAVTSAKILVWLFWMVLVAGSVVTFCGAVLAVLWVLDVTITRVLRMTRTMPLFLRFAWLEAAQKKALRDDVERLQQPRNLE